MQKHASRDAIIVSCAASLQSCKPANGRAACVATMIGLLVTNDVICLLDRMKAKGFHKIHLDDLVINPPSEVIGSLG